MRAIILAVIFLLAAAAPVFACECGPWRVVEYEFEHHPTVFVAEFQSVRLVKKKKRTIEISTFIVTHSLKGKYKVGARIVFKRPAFRNCIWSFIGEPAGERFLFYLDEKTKGSGPSTCNRSGRMSNSHPDATRIE
jgi:hypothetical protein